MPLNIISLGAGVQSTVMALMAAKGEIVGPDGGRPSHLIFSDTGWEPSGIYKHLDWCEAEIKRLSNGQMTLHRVNNGNIREMLLSAEPGRYAAVPFYLKNEDGSRGMSRRQCTHEFKLKPLYWKARELWGVGRRERIPPGSVRTWIGISTDEAQRMKPSHAQWCENYYPLIEARMSRADCHAWFSRHYPGRRLVKSSCIGCPFHNDSMWREMKRDDPHSFADAVVVDHAIRDGGTAYNADIRGKQFIHSSLKPLDEADLGDEDTPDMFGNECEGMCGV